MTIFDLGRNLYRGADLMQRRFIKQSATVPIPGLYTENFNLSNQAGWGPNFRLDVNTPQIKNGAAHAGNLGMSSGTVQYWGTFTGGNINTDDCSVSIRAQQPDFGNSNNTASDMRVGIFLRATNVHNTGTKCGLTMTAGQGCKIVSWNGGTPTVRASVSRNIGPNSLVEFRATGNVYNGFIDGEGLPFITWVDSTNIVTRGVNNRKFQMLQEANYPFLQREWASFAVSDYVISEG